MPQEYLFLLHWSNYETRIWTRSKNMKFKVAVIETYKEIIEIEAENEQDAVNEAWKRYQEEENLGGDIDIVDVAIEIEE